MMDNRGGGGGGGRLAKEAIGQGRWTDLINRFRGTRKMHRRICNGSSCTINSPDVLRVYKSFSQSKRRTNPTHRLLPEKDQKDKTEKPDHDEEHTDIKRLSAMPTLLPQTPRYRNNGIVVRTGQRLIFLSCKLERLTAQSKHLLRIS